MSGLHRFLTLTRPLSQVVGFGIVQKQGDVLIQRRMILLERQDLIGILWGDGAGKVLLAAHGITRHEASLQV